MELSCAEFARFMGVSRPHISKLLKDGVLTTLPSGKLDLAVAVRSYVTNLKRSQAQAVVGGARAKYLAQQERRLRLQNDEREGKLLRLDDVDHGLQAAMTVLRTGCLALPGRVAPIVAAMNDAAAVRAYMSKEVETVLREMADALLRWVAMEREALE